MGNFKGLRCIAVLLLWGTSMSAGCTETSRTAQAAVSLKVPDTKTAEIVRDSVEQFAHGKGFDYKTRAGNSEYLEKSGMFQWLLIRNYDKSFVSVQNILKSECVNISVYSAEGAEAANSLSKEILQAVKSAVEDQVIAYSGTGCKSE